MKIHKGSVSKNLVYVLHSLVENNYWVLYMYTVIVPYICIIVLLCLTGVMIYSCDRTSYHRRSKLIVLVCSDWYIYKVFMFYDGWLVLTCSLIMGGTRHDSGVLWGIHDFESILILGFKPGDSDLIWSKSLIFQMVCPSYVAFA